MRYQFNYFFLLSYKIGKSIRGTENIKNEVSKLNLAGAQVDLSNGSIDAQRTDNNGVLVVVTGHYTPPQQEKKEFIQTFFLACQPESPSMVSLNSHSFNFYQLLTLLLHNLIGTALLLCQ